MAKQKVHKKEYYSFVPGEVMFTVDHKMEFGENRAKLFKAVNIMLEKVIINLLTNLFNFDIDELEEQIIKFVEESRNTKENLMGLIQGLQKTAGKEEMFIDTLKSSIARIDFTDEIDPTSNGKSNQIRERFADYRSDAENRSDNVILNADLHAAVIKPIQTFDSAGELRHTVLPLLVSGLINLGGLFDHQEAIEFERPKWARGKLPSENESDPEYFTIIQSAVPAAKTGPVAELSILLLSLLMSLVDVTIEHNGNKVRLSSTAPNWILPSTGDTDPNQGTGGGPGTKPVKIDPLINGDEPWKFIVHPDFDTDAAQDLKKILKDDPEIAPTVIILDTAPPAFELEHDPRFKAKVNGKPQKDYGRNTLQAAYGKWKDDNPLLGKLLKDIGQLKIEEVMNQNPKESKPKSVILKSNNGSTISTYNIRQGDDNAKTGRFDLKIELENMTIWYADELMYAPYGPDYDNDDEFDLRRICKAMKDKKDHEFRHIANDHGTFIAGIIHSICPTAHIHLVQVLNDYGHGSVLLAASQLQRVLDELTIQAGTLPRIVLNMSLMFDIPSAEDHKFATSSKETGNAKDHRKVIEDLLKALGRKFVLEKMVLGWHYITELIAVGEPETNEDTQQGLMFAAAGNDRDAGQLPPKARFPAAFINVVGTGAVKPDLKQYTDYSNIADRPEDSGIAAVGGNEWKDEPGWSDDTKGLLGLYINRFPNKTDKNKAEVHLPNENGWAKWSGTSFAVPVIVGVVAQILANKPEWSASQVIEFIRSTYPEDQDLPETLPLIQKSQQ